ncbi:MAG: FtsX-like permease family protein [Candidatus Dormibacteria bacterium]
MMPVGLWLRGLLRHIGRLTGMAVGIAIAVAMVASIGSFLTASQTTMTSRSVANVPVDWQVETQPGANAATVLATVRSQRGVAVTEPVMFARTTGLSATTGGSTQATGPGVIVGISATYATTFPAEIRPLVGSASGVLIAQQTASNLRAKPGDSVVIGRYGLTPVTVKIDGVIDLPQADTFFQKVGAPVGSQPSAPPDNVLVLPVDTWHVLFDALATSQPSQVKQQIHVRLERNLPAAPADAFDQVSGAARNLEVRLAGAGLVGNNIGAALDAARSDAAYATVMFLFLGLPGAALAALLVAAVASSGADRRRREQAMLRARGATLSMLARLSAVEAFVAGVAGVAIGLAAAIVIGQLAFGSAAFGLNAGGTAIWAGAAAAAGLATALLVIAIPAWRDARHTTVVGARQGRVRAGVPPWVRLSAAVALVGAALAIFFITSQQGYQLVLAPEGVASITVDYFAFLGPACLWIGIGLLTWRLAEALLLRGRRILAAAVRPIAGGLATTVAASMGRQHRLIAPAAVMIGITVAFAVSTSVFNSTYIQQAEADARLTNGSDVTVTLPGSTVGPNNLATTLASVNGVHGVEPIMHRYAYVGADLQDLYGVRASTIGAAGSLQNAYFVGGSAADLMNRLSTHSDGILVSAETARDFQLAPGSHLVLRMQDRLTHALTNVTFQFIGIVKEFPTAPRDSFLVANAGYVGAATHDASPSTYLIDTTGASPSAVASAVRAVVGVGPQVSDISSTRRIVGSSLTAVDLGGLTRVELCFAFAFMIAATSLVLALGFAERRRTYALAAALGARPRQLGAFLWSEAGFVLVAGILCGALAGWVLTEMLVAVLTGVFDPAPAALAVPWVYLASLLVLSLATVAVVVVVGARRMYAAPAALIRDF